MMKQVRVFLILSLLLPGFSFQANSQGHGALSLAGSVMNEKGEAIDNARVAVVQVVAEKKLPGSQRVVYSNTLGNWKVKVPGRATFLIKVSANGYESTQKVYAPGTGAEPPGKIEFILKEGLANIAWGSLEHLQLYVKPSRQREMEELIALDQIKMLEDFLENGFKARQKQYAYAFAGYLCFENSKIEASRSYFQKAGSKLWFNLMGRLSLRNKQYEESLAFYEQGVTTSQKAADLFLLGRTFEKKGDGGRAKAAYGKALADYKKLSTSFLYIWDSEYIQDGNSCRVKLGKEGGHTGGTGKDNGELEKLLKEAGAYCQKLNKVAIYYYCHEVKRDHVFLVEKLAKALERPADFFKNFSPIRLRGPQITDYYKYDLQFIKEKEKGIQENRKLLEEHLDNSNPGIPVRSYSIRKALHGPHTLIGLGWQSFFDYKIVGRETLFGQETVIIEAIPRWDGFLNKMSGKVWVVPGSGCVLKIEWYHRRTQDKELIRARGLILNREPRQVFISEFGRERKGLWFPTRCSIVESYLQPGQKPFVRLRIEIDYENYNFFTVDDSVEYKY